ncbi:MAG: HYExAFE family protein [Planctomycetes bacterium]|nr:HYExAFE family protein [Planctomycetota bacterium]
MADRSVHYEAAFEDYIRSRGLPYVAVDEAKKAIFGAASIKSFDFLVYSSAGPNLLIDVKGRKFPGELSGRKRGACRTWENWITRQDAEGLTEWEKVFGGDFQAVLVFAYWLQGRPGRSPFQDVHVFRRKHYAFAAVSLADYLKNVRPRSRKWETISMPSVEFAAAAMDIASFL